MLYTSSTNVKMYPSSFRGDNVEQSTTKLYDVESRLATEKNLTGYYSRIASKDSYIIDWDKTSKVLKCIISGYYFELSLADFLASASVSSLTNIYAHIKVENREVTVAIKNTTFSTGMLEAVDGNDTTLDIENVFKGLGLSENSTEAGVTASLHILTRADASSEWNAPKLEKARFTTEHLAILNSNGQVVKMFDDIMKLVSVGGDLLQINMPLLVDGDINLLEQGNVSANTITTSKVVFGQNKYIDESNYTGTALSSTEVLVAPINNDNVNYGVLVTPNAGVETPINSEITVNPSTQVIDTYGGNNKKYTLKINNVEGNLTGTATNASVAEKAVKVKVEVAAFEGETHGLAMFKKSSSAQPEYDTLKFASNLTISDNKSIEAPNYDVRFKRLIGTELELAESGIGRTGNLTCREIVTEGLAINRLGDIFFNGGPKIELSAETITLYYVNGIIPKATAGRISYIGLPSIPFESANITSVISNSVKTANLKVNTSATIKDCDIETLTASSISATNFALTSNYTPIVLGDATSGTKTRLTKDGEYEIILTYELPAGVTSEVTKYEQHLGIIRYVASSDVIPIIATIDGNLKDNNQIYFIKVKYTNNAFYAGYEPINGTAYGDATSFANNDPRNYKLYYRKIR